MLLCASFTSTLSTQLYLNDLINANICIIHSPAITHYIPVYPCIYTPFAPQIAEDQSRRQSEQDRIREEIRLSEESRALKDQDEKVR
jgi:hypothetical protein